MDPKDGKKRKTAATAQRRYYYLRSRVLTDFVDLGLSQLTRSEIAVYLILLRDTKPTGLARTGLTDLARRGGMSVRSASRAVQSLIGRKVVRLVKPGLKGKASLYTIFPPEWLAEINPTATAWLTDQNKVSVDTDGG